MGGLDDILGGLVGGKGGSGGLDDMLGGLDRRARRQRWWWLGDGGAPARSRGPTGEWRPFQDHGRPEGERAFGTGRLVGRHRSEPAGQRSRRRAGGRSRADSAGAPSSSASPSPRPPTPLPRRCRRSWTRSRPMGSFLPNRTSTPPSTSWPRPAPSNRLLLGNAFGGQTSPLKVSQSPGLPDS